MSNQFPTPLAIVVFRWLYWVSKTGNREKNRGREGIQRISSSGVATPSSFNLNMLCNYLKLIFPLEIQCEPKKCGKKGWKKRIKCHFSFALRACPRTSCHIT
jgi:hypothetical protein